MWREHTVPQPVEDVLAPIFFERLDDVGMVTDDQVGPGIYQRSSDLDGSQRRQRHLFVSPVSHHDDAVGTGAPSRGDVPHRPFEVEGCGSWMFSTVVNGSRTLVGVSEQGDR